MNTQEYSRHRSSNEPCARYQKVMSLVMAAIFLSLCKPSLAPEHSIRGYWDCDIARQFVGVGIPEYARIKALEDRFQVEKSDCWAQLIWDGDERIAYLFDGKGQQAKILYIMVSRRESLVLAGEWKQYKSLQGVTELYLRIDGHSEAETPDDRNRYIDSSIWKCSRVVRIDRQTGDPVLEPASEELCRPSPELMRWIEYLREE